MAARAPTQPAPAAAVRSLAAALAARETVTPTPLFRGVNGAGSTGVAAYGGSPGGAGGAVGTTITTNNIIVPTPTGGARGNAEAPSGGRSGRGGSVVFVNSGTNSSIGIGSVALTVGRGGIGAGGGAGLMIAQGVTTLARTPVQVTCPPWATSTQNGAGVLTLTGTAAVGDIVNVGNGTSRSAMAAPAGTSIRRR